MDDAHSERGLDAFGRPRLGGIGEMLAPLIEEATGIETRATTLGHIQRGGTPSAFDRVLATRFGMSVINLVNDQQWGHMVALRGTDIKRVDFVEALGDLKTVPDERYEAAAMLFGSPRTFETILRSRRWGRAPSRSMFTTQRSTTKTRWHSPVHRVWCESPH